MIIFGPFTALADIIDSPNTICFNVSSPVPRGYDIRYIYPPITEMSQIQDEYAYDMYLANYLMNTSQGFTGLMNIIYSVYNGYDVIVLIDDSPWMVYLTESLIKFIQCRYGIESNLINERDDLECVKKDIHYSLIGRQNLQADKEKFVYGNFDYFMAMEAPSEEEG